METQSRNSRARPRCMSEALPLEGTCSEQSRTHWSHQTMILHVTLYGCEMSFPLTMGQCTD
jgi:hypothetical protein